MKRKFGAIILLMLASGFVGSARANGPTDTQPSSASKLTIKFDRIAASLAPGQVFANGKVGLLCIPHEKWNWASARSMLNLNAFSEVFHQEALALDLPVAGDPTSLFGDTGVRDADLLIGASIYHLSMDICAPWAANLNATKGAADMGIEWQIYSKHEGRVIYRVRTIASFRKKETTDGGTFKLLYGAFKENIRNLAEDSGFRLTLLAM